MLVIIRHTPWWLLNRRPALAQACEPVLFHDHVPWAGRLPVGGGERVPPAGASAGATARGTEFAGA
jgi:hypothetical protein